MTARPILFSTPMVEAILAGRKTQTRRPLRPQPADYLHGRTPAELEPGVWAFWTEPQGERSVRACHTDDLAWCLYGKPGDVLWVREAFTIAHRNCWAAPKTISPERSDEAAYYRAGWERSEPRWKPGIHMPRWACRLELSITAVRLQRLSALTEEDAQAEGCADVDAFRCLWDRMWEKHGDRAMTCAGDPWLWAISFRVATP